MQCFGVNTQYPSTICDRKGRHRQDSFRGKRTATHTKRNPGHFPELRDFQEISWKSVNRDAQEQFHLEEARTSQSSDDVCDDNSSQDFGESDATTTRRGLGVPTKKWAR